MAKKRWLGLALASIMVVMLLTACGSNNDPGSNKVDPTAAPTSTASSTNNTGGADQGAANPYGDTGGLALPIVDKPTTLTWMLVSDHALNDKAVMKEIEKRTGITLDIQAYSSSTYKDKLRMTVASGKLPDIFHGLVPAELKKIGSQNAVVAINDYADSLPNFKRLYMDENPWVINSYGDENGKLYTWPIYNMNRDVNHGMMYRKDIFDKNGIAEWTNEEEFYQALKKLKEIYPDSYPLASKTKEGIFRDLSYGWGLGSVNYPVNYDEQDKAWQFAPIQQEHKDMLDFLKKLFNEGLLDPEFLTDTPDSWTSKMTTGKSFVTWDWIGRLELFYNQVSPTNPEFNLRYGNPVGPTGNVRTLPEVEANFGITVANNSNKEVALKLLDYLTSPSGAALITLGIEGETFNFDADGKPVYPELKDLPLVDIKVLEERYGMWAEGMYLAPDRRSVYYNLTEKEQEAQDKIMSANKFEALDPVLNFTDEETGVIAEYHLALDKAANEFNAKYVLTKSYGDKEWQEWQQSVKKLGADEIVKVYHEAQKRFDAAN